MSTKYVYFDVKDNQDYSRLKIRFKITNAQNLLKFDTFDISNIPILILMSKIIFVKYLPAVRSN